MNRQGDAKIIQKKNIALCIYFALAALLLLFPLLMGIAPIEKADTEVYAAWKSYVPPMFPVLIRGFRFLFGEGAHYYVITILQSLVGATCIVRLTMVLDRTFGLRKWQKIAAFILLLFSMLLMGMAMGVDDKHYDSPMIYMITDGLCLSLFFLTTSEILMYCRESTAKRLANMMIVTGLLVLTRTQFLSVFGMIFLVFAYQLVIQKSISIKGFLLRLLVIGVTVLCILGLQRLYILSTECDERASYNTRNELGHLMFFSERSDFDAIEDSAVRDLFYGIYDEIALMGPDEEGYLLSSVDDNWRHQMNYYIAAMNPIYHALDDSVRPYVTDVLGVTDRAGIEREVSGIYKSVHSILAPKYRKIWVITSFKEFPLSMAYALTTVYPDGGSQKIRMLVATILIAVSIIGILLHMIRFCGLRGESMFMIMQLIFLFGNAVVANYVMRAVLRYMLYCFPVFYIGLILLYSSLAKKG